MKKYLSMVLASLLIIITSTSFYIYNQNKIVIKELTEKNLVLSKNIKKLELVEDKNDKNIASLNKEIDKLKKEKKLMNNNNDDELIVTDNYNAVSLNDKDIEEQLVPSNKIVVDEAQETLDIAQETSNRDTSDEQLDNEPSDNKEEYAIMGDYPSGAFRFSSENLISIEDFWELNPDAKNDGIKPGMSYRIK